MNNQFCRVFLTALLALSSAMVSLAAEPNPIKKGLDEAAQRLKKDEKTLRADLKSSNIEDKIGAALVLWTKFPTAQPEVLSVMKNDKNPDVRRRISQVLAAKYKVAEATEVLEKVLREFDTKTEYGASRFLGAASILQGVTGKSYGGKEALEILTAPNTAFPDADSLSYSEIRKDGLRIAAASNLAQQKEMSGNPDFRKGLKAYCVDLEGKIEKASEKDRLGWQRRLRTVLDISTRANLSDLAIEYSNHEQKIKDSYEKENFKRVIDKAKNRK